jgi:hypothetical protein
MTKDTELINASPVKSFFVDMLTRDISTEDAILDLLDNCVDGILRSKPGMSSDTPYHGYEAVIRFDSDGFSISDNCGGIPWSLHDYAFRMGRSPEAPREHLPTVGVYGIGMKRAIFKLGHECIVTSRADDKHYRLHFKPTWMRDEKNWEVPVDDLPKTAKRGTTIEVSRLRPGVRSLFADSARGFEEDFRRRVATHFAFIIAKGFVVRINGQRVVPRPTELVIDKAGKKKGTIRPFLYKGSFDGVDVFLAIGLTRPIPSEDEIMRDAAPASSFKTLEAGWTVLCNDRAVLYCDRSELTGWGEAGIPRYHTQFIAISGVVEFTSADASKLPTTTTKRGIDAASTLYLRVKNKMREGLKVFTDFTYWWKGREAEAKAIISRSPAMDVRLLKSKMKEDMRQIPGDGRARQYRPSLPRPKEQDSGVVSIKFRRSVSEVELVAEHLEVDPDSPSDVGAACFDHILRKARS